LAKKEGSAEPRPGDLRVWKQVDANGQKRIFFVTRLDLAPGELWWSSAEANACYYISDGAEDWHYIETVKFGSDLLAEGCIDPSGSLESQQSLGELASNRYHSGAEE
jgi:hypothetical protein